MSAVVIGADGLARCAWGAEPADYRTYHDDEWGRPVHGDGALYERISLEAFQSGLSWLTILRKREAFRKAFAGFVPDRVADYGPRDVERLMQDPGIVRNRRKIEATITNARALLRLRDARGEGCLDALIWSFQPPHRGPRARSLGELAAQTEASRQLSRDLKSHGFVFVGPTTMHAAMQACGVIDDHLVGCHRAT